MLSLLTMSQTADDDNDDQNKKEEDSQYNGCYFSGGKPCTGCGGSSVPSSGCQKMMTMWELPIKNYITRQLWNSFVLFLVLETYKQIFFTNCFHKNELYNTKWFFLSNAWMYWFFFFCGICKLISQNHIQSHHVQSTVKWWEAHTSN